MPPYYVFLLLQYCKLRRLQSDAAIPLPLLIMKVSFHQTIIKRSPKDPSRIFKGSSKDPQRIRRSNTATPADHQSILSSNDHQRVLIGSSKDPQRILTKGSSKGLRLEGRSSWPGASGGLGSFLRVTDGADGTHNRYETYTTIPWDSVRENTRGEG